VRPREQARVERVVERGGGKPSVLGAAVALSCGITAASGPKAREHAPCKRHVELACHDQHCSLRIQLLGT
jgi:hypothetical protein